MTRPEAEPDGDVGDAAPESGGTHPDPVDGSTRRQRPRRPDHTGSGEAADEPPADPAAERRAMLMESIGGWRGMFDSGVPVAVFVIVNAIWGLTAGIWSAVGAGLVVLILRLLRRQSVQQAIGGFFAVAIAVFIARQTGEAKGFFLLGIWRSLILGGLVVLSVVIRWPIVGVIWEYLQPSGRAWRRDRRLMIVYSWTTLLLAALFGVRFLVEQFLYAEDQTGWLAVARIALGYPLWLVVLGVIFFGVRRVRRREGIDGHGSAKHRAQQPDSG